MRLAGWRARQSHDGDGADRDDGRRRAGCGVCGGGETGRRPDVEPLTRRARPRGVRTGKRGTALNELVPVLIVRDRHRATSNAVLAGLRAETIGRQLLPLLAEDALLCTDATRAYAQITHAAGEHVRNHVLRIQTSTPATAGSRGGWRDFMASLPDTSPAISAGDASLRTWPTPSIPPPSSCNADSTCSHSQCEQRLSVAFQESKRAFRLERG